MRWIREVDRAIVSGVSETEIQQIKQEYITDRIKESIDVFGSQPERNNLELERDSLKGLAKLTKKGELQSRIDRKNKKIELLKVGLSGIVKRYEFQTVHDFYKAFVAARTAYADYRDKADKWEKRYGEKAQRQQKESIYKRLQNY